MYKIFRNKYLQDCPQGKILVTVNFIFGNSKTKVYFVRPVMFASRLGGGGGGQGLKNHNEKVGR